MTASPLLSRGELHDRRVEDADPVEHKGEEPEGERDRRGRHYRLSPKPALLALIARGDEVAHRRRHKPGEVVAVLLEARWSGSPHLRGLSAKASSSLAA